MTSIVELKPEVRDRYVNDLGFAEGLVAFCMGQKRQDNPYLKTNTLASIISLMAWHMGWDVANAMRNAEDTEETND